LSGLTLGTSPGAVTLSPGVYCFGSSAQLTGTLTLSGSGVYIFQVGTTLTTASSSSVVLASGATATDVFWQVGTSATLGANTSFVGSIFASISDTITAGSSVYGRVFALNGAVTLDTNVFTASPVGRWEIVHTSGDSPDQLALYPGSFSTFLSDDGTGYTYATFTSSICVIDAETYNVVPTWTSSDGIHFVITIAVNNLGVGPDFSFVYTGTYSEVTPVPGDSSLFIPAISGTYSSVGTVSACSVNGTGNFIATFLPTISSGSAMGALDGFSADNGSAFDATVSATITFSAPPADGQLAGTVVLATNPTFHLNPCFATTGSVVNSLTINPSKSSQSGTSEYIFAEGFDPGGVPTTLFLNGASVNLYNTPPANTDPNATQITSTQWAATAAIGEDNPAAPGTTGVQNDGTNVAMVFSYGILGGACNDAGGVDAPFQFVSGTPIVHKHKEHRRHNSRDLPKHGRGRVRDD
jgi:hypothetical protein